MRLHADQSLLLLIDFQSRLLPVIPGAEQGICEAGWLAGVACELGMPVWLTEQNPAQLGHTEASLTQALGEYEVWEKQHFSITEEPAFMRALEKTGRRQIVLCGTEAHICVLQSALGFLEAGFEVYWLVEATLSRRPAEAELARARAGQHGAVSISADMAAYEWLHRCDTALFKRIHRQFLKPRAGRALSFTGDPFRGA
ncbi:isochorismatase family protein [Halomonas sp. PAMB 3232]|uniref:isochorismatase family protein n=1 Tax=Halomonas sp. PAMB 3232 TaxID=3075221 RepID=UPI002896F641|nr:isochorismatase family protein [Halomonas sp. PAMB 3232]WNL39355.1 isochorismatase family protein [Halomonas sp. PAMB 3232]